MSHYKFQSMIAHEWMELGYYKKPPLPKSFQIQSGREYFDVYKSLSSGSTGSCGTRRKRLSEILLSPCNGALKCRMDQTISHLLLMSSSVRYCQLHYWCTGKRSRLGLILFLDKILNYVVMQ